MSFFLLVLNCFSTCCVTLFFVYLLPYYLWSDTIIPFFYIILLICPSIRSDLIKLNTIESNLLSLIILFDVRPQLEPDNEFNHTIMLIKPHSVAWATQEITMTSVRPSSDHLHSFQTEVCWWTLPPRGRLQQETSSFCSSL